MHKSILMAASSLALALPHSSVAQGASADSVVRVHVITLDSTWYATGALVAITGDSVVVRTDSGSTRAAFDRIHVLSVERRKPSAGAGHPALVGCAAVGGALGVLGVLSIAFPGHDNSGDIDERSLGIALTVVLGLGGCALGAAVGAVAGAAHHYRWETITLPPRTGTEADTAAARISFGQPFPQHLM